MEWSWNFFDIELNELPAFHVKRSAMKLFFQAFSASLLFLTSCSSTPNSTVGNTSGTTIQVPTESANVKIPAKPPINNPNFSAGNATRNTVQGVNQTVNNVNRVGNAIRSVNLIRGLFN